MNNIIKFEVPEKIEAQAAACYECGGDIFHAMLGPQDCLSLEPLEWQASVMMAVEWLLIKLTQKTSTKIGDWEASGAPLNFSGRFLVPPALLLLGRW